MASLAAWLAGVKCSQLLRPLDALGVETVDDLVLLEKEDIDELCAKVKKIPARKFRNGVDALQPAGSQPLREGRPQRPEQRAERSRQPTARSTGPCLPQ